MRAADRVPTLLLLGLLLAAVFAACSDPGSIEGGGGAPGRGIYVQASWQTNRRVTGHRVHVVEQRIACNRCHALTGDSMGRVVPERCAACHEKEARITHAQAEARERFGPDAKSDCLTCHSFTIADSGHEATLDGGIPEVPSPTDCARCHQKEQGEHTPAVTVHASAECVHCHHPHRDDKPVSAPCSECHKDLHTSHASLGKSATEVCTTCHTHQHAPGSDAIEACQGCHAAQKPLVPASALFPDGHTQCVGCHRPHSFEAKSAVACRSCHADVLVLAAGSVPQHTQCTNCHAPHDVRGSPEHACANCHKDVHPDHPERAGAGTCTSCHDPHPGRERLHALARNCSSCHQLAASEHDFHGGLACDQCHKPHHFAIELADHQLCQGCHSKQVTLVSAQGGHSACEGCHRGLPHRPATLQAPCATCHENVHREANAGHQACTGCHEPHSGGIATQCGNCHKAEATGIVSGHRTCTGCHQPHSGSPAGVPCATCHAKEADSPHGHLSATCTSCHRPHGPNGVASPPACTSCHALDTLPGLHAEAQHKNCTRCHSGHGDAPNAARAACLACHADRRDHFPDAPRCANCHLFSKAR